MKILFKTILYVVIFCSVPWFLANNEQRQDLKARYEAIIAFGAHFLPAHTKQQTQLKDVTEVLSGLDKSPKEGNEKIIGSGEKYQVNSCSKVISSKVGHKIKIYEWTDDKGRKQLSDTPPRGSYTSLKVRGLYVDNYFNLKLDSRYANLPAFTQSHIQSGVTKIYKTLVQVIKVSELRAIDLNLKFFSNKEQFHKYRQKVAPDTGFKTTGFYTSRLNEATIFAVGSKDHMTSITLHESTHAIVAAMFGGAPVWLNEGLASFFDQMIITGEQTYMFSTDERKFKLLRSSVLPSLKSHFSQSPKQWYAYTNDDLNYAVDWSLVFYMMINSNRRDFLRGMLEHLAMNDCHEFSTVVYIDQHYPGGVSRLELNWLSWLKNAPSGTITF